MPLLFAYDRTGFLMTVLIFHLKGVTLVYVFLFLVFDRNFCVEHSVEPDQTPHFAVSDLGLQCLSRSHAWHIWVNETECLFPVCE